MTTTVEQLLARLGSGIESTPGVCGGDPRIADTRIPVWTLEQYHRLGMTEAQFLASYPESGRRLGQRLGLRRRASWRDRPADPRERGGVAVGPPLGGRELPAAGGRSVEAAGTRRADADGGGPSRPGGRR